MKLPNWPALIGAPAVALTCESILYALVYPSCSSQSVAWLHAISAASVALCVLMTAPAAMNAWRLRPFANGPAGAAEGRGLMLAQVATMAGALSALVVLAEWIPNWILSPCAA